MTAWRVKEWAVVLLLLGVAGGLVWLGVARQDRGVMVGGLAVAFGALSWLHLVAGWGGR